MAVSFCLAAAAAAAAEAAANTLLAHLEPASGYYETPN